MRLALLLITLSSLTSLACADDRPPAADRPPNVLWLIAENIGPDLGCYGYPTVRTPNLDRFAAAGQRYELAFATAPICSPSRSAFLTGVYQTQIDAQNHSSHFLLDIDAGNTLPESVVPLPLLLRDAGYFPANIERMDGEFIGTGKVELNFDVGGEPLRPVPTVRPGAGPRKEQNAENSARLYAGTQWEELKDNQPFFAQVNLPVVERRGNGGWACSAAEPWLGQTHPETTSPDDVVLAPYTPDTPIVRRDWAGYIDAVNAVDARSGAILDRLAADGLAENTIVIFFGDNGRLEHRGHGWCYDSGDRVPLIVRWPHALDPPAGYEPGGVSDRLVSLLDLPATTLAIAGRELPEGMPSRVFLGDEPGEPREVVFSARDRHDEVAARIRSVRSRRWRYIRNFTPDVTVMSLHRYKEAFYPVVKELRRLHAAGKLQPPAAALMRSRMPIEELYDTEADPFEIANLAGDPEHAETLRRMRTHLDEWIARYGDTGLRPEHPEVLHWWRDAMDKRFGTPDWAD